MMTRDKGFYRTFIRLCATLMLEQAVVLSVNLADNMMLGTYSEAALSGVAAVNQIQFLLQQIVYGIGNGLIAIGSQYWGQHRTREIRAAASVAIRFEVLVALALFTCASVIPEKMVMIFSTNPDIVREGAEYLGIIRFSYLLFALTAVLLNAMRTVEKVGIALKVSVVSLVINISINYLLIEGHLGCPELGVKGAAIGTLAARAVEFVIVLIYVAKDKVLCLRLRDLVRTDRVIAGDFVRVTLPILGAGFLWGVANALQTVILGHMNDSAIAAQSISSTVFLLLKVTSVGAASAASVIIGKAVGRGDMAKIKEYSRTLQIMFLGIGALLMGIMLVVRFPLLSVYKKKISPETYDLASVYMLIQAVVLFTMSYQMPTNCGIIRGGGSTRYVFVLDCIAIATGIPLAYLGGLVWGWSAIAVIIVMNADQVLKCIPAFIVSNRYRWVKRLTRDDKGEGA